MNEDVCVGMNCPVKMTCIKHLRWLSSDDEDGDEMLGRFGDECEKYEQREFYGG